MPYACVQIMRFFLMISGVARRCQPPEKRAFMENALTGEVWMLKLSRIMALGAALFMGTSFAQAVEKPQEWELVNPTGVIRQAQIEPAARITTLEGKTIALCWNSKNNGDLVLDRIAELLARKYPSAKVVKTYRTNPELNIISGSAEKSDGIVKAIAAVKPDLVIAAQCD